MTDDVTAQSVGAGTALVEEDELETLANAASSANGATVATPDATLIGADTALEEEEVQEPIAIAATPASGATCAP